MAQVVKNPPAAQETQKCVRSLGQEDSLEEEMAIYSSILVSKIPWTEESGGLQSMELQRARHNLAHIRVCTHTHTDTHIYLHTPTLIFFIRVLMDTKHSSTPWLL